MSVLKKIGLFLVGAGADVTKIMGFPFISQLLGAIPGKFGSVTRTAVADLDTFAGFLSIGELAYPSIEGSKTGSQKLAMVTPLVQKSVLLWAQSSLPGHNKLLVTPEVFAGHCQALTSDFADILNDFGE